jgi:hypothetical protein
VCVRADLCGGTNRCRYWTLADSVVHYSDATVSVTLGVPDVMSHDTSGIAAAVAVATAADHVILAVGTNLDWAHEEYDAETIVFTDAQTQLISQVRVGQESTS